MFGSIQTGLVLQLSSHTFVFFAYITLCAYVHVCVFFMSRCLKRLEEDVRFSRAELTSVCRYPMCILECVGHKCSCAHR